MVGEVEKAQADVAREEHERLCERANKGAGRDGVTRLRSKVRDAQRVKHGVPAE